MAARAKSAVVIVRDSLGNRLRQELTRKSRMFDGIRKLYKLNLMYGRLQAAEAQAVAVNELHRPMSTKDGKVCTRCRQLFPCDALRLSEIILKTTADEPCTQL